MSKRQFTTVQATEVKKHDMIANFGIVDAEPVRVGVFVVLLVRGTVWTLGDGRGDIVRRDLVLIQNDEVVLDTTPDGDRP